MAGRGTARATDGVELAVTRFPAKGAARATLVLPGAMGVRQDFYAPFASFLAESGIHALTFDYRGMGWSRSGSLRGYAASVSDWAERDLGGMLAEAQRAAPGLPLLVLGHSLGGQVLAVVPGAGDVRAMVTVTSGTGWYRHNDRMPLEVRFFWFVAIPALTPVFGYFPGKSLRMVGDLPAGVAWQWRKWSTHPDYLLAEGDRYREAFNRFTAPILGYSFEDDAIVTRPAIDHMHSIYQASAVERRHIAPAELGERRLGHFGFFSNARRGDLWQEALAWLLART